MNQFKTNSQQVQFQIMDIEEFKFIYEDIKQEIGQIPHLQTLLKLTQKTTKKLQCLNLYSQMDKKMFDLEIQQNNIYTDIFSLYQNIQTLKEDYHLEFMGQIEENIFKIKQKNIRMFDILTKQDQLLTKETQYAQKLLHEDEKDSMIQIKQMDQYEDDQFQLQMEPNIEQFGFQNPAKRIQKLKTQIDQINTKISKLNSGKGKWFDTDHKDFVKIYTKCSGNEKRIMQEGVKILGMTATQIMDHLQLYQNYLQLEKQKKLASQQYKQIKLLQKSEQQDEKLLKQRKKEEQIKLKLIQQKEDRLKKKQAVEQFRKNKMIEKQNMINQQEMETKKRLPPPLAPSKKKQIIQRNMKMIQKKQAEFKRSVDKIDKKLIRQKSKQMRK